MESAKSMFPTLLNQTTIHSYPYRREDLFEKLIQPLGDLPDNLGLLDFEAVWTFRRRRRYLRDLLTGRFEVSD